MKVDNKFIKLLLLLLILVIPLSGCIGWIDMFAYDKKLIGPYHLADDLGEPGRGIYYQIEEGLSVDRIRPQVKAVGWNEEFIIAKQFDSDNQQNAYYYIIDILKDQGHNSVEESVIVPMNEEEFLRRRTALNLPGDLTFTLEIE